MKYAAHLGYTDINPYEVVRVVSDKTIEIRSMDSEQDRSFKPEFVPGGFSACCVNQSEQKWFITSNTENEVFRIRLSKNRGWQDKHGRRFKLTEKPVKFYDYNF